jgi:hypothetical protein
VGRHGRRRADRLDRGRRDRRRRTLRATDASGRLVEIVAPGTTAAWLDKMLPEAETVCSIVGAILVLGVGLAISRRNKARAEKT